MFLSEDGELYSCGSDNLQDPTDILYTERLYPEKVNIPRYCILDIIFIKMYFFLKISEFQGQIVTDVATGPDHVLVLTARGDVWAWGNNSEGILGFGHNLPVQKPIIIPILSDKNIKQVK